MNQDLEERILRLQREIDVLSSIKNKINKKDPDLSPSFNSEILGSCKDILNDLDYKIIEYKCRGINTSSNGSTKSVQNGSSKSIQNRSSKSIQNGSSNFNQNASSKSNQNGSSKFNDDSDNNVSETEKLSLKSDIKCNCKDWIIDSFPTISRIKNKKNYSIKSLYYNDKVRPKSMEKRIKKECKCRGKIKKPATAPTRNRTLKSIKPVRLSKADCHFDSKLLGYGLIDSELHDRCCKYKKILDHTIKDTNNKIDDLQVQFDESHANIEFLSAGRKFLIKTLDVLKSKYFNLKDAYIEVCNENKKLKEDNQKFLTNLPDIEKSCDEFHECQLMVLRLQDDNIKLQKTICSLKDAKEKTFEVLKKQNRELDLENCKLMYQINFERSKNLMNLTQFENKLLNFISLEQKNKDTIRHLRNLILNLKLSNVLKENDTKHLGKQLCNMKVECSTLKKYISHLRAEDDKKMRMIETELMKYRNSLTHDENKLILERDGILDIIENLSTMVFSHRMRIAQLMDVNKKLGTLVASQHKILSQKEKEISVAEDIINSAVQQSINLNQVINALELSLTLSEYFSSSMLSIISNKTNETSGCCKGIEFIQQDLMNTRSSLEEEKYKLAIKDKIIGDQADTIRNLKGVKSKKSCKCEKLLVGKKLEDFSEPLSNSKSILLTHLRASSGEDKQNIDKVNEIDILKNTNYSCNTFGTSIKGEKRLTNSEQLDSNGYSKSSYSTYSSSSGTEKESLVSRDKRTEKTERSNSQITDLTLATQNKCSNPDRSERSDILKSIDSMKLLKKKLLNEIRTLEQKRNNLLRHVIDINSNQDLSSISSSELDRKIEEQHKILKKLEEEVANKQEEWANQQRILYNEKMQAIEIARFATDKLLETIYEFQKQTVRQKKARDKVKEIINKKFSLHDIPVRGTGSIQTLYKSPTFTQSECLETESNTC